MTEPNGARGLERRLGLASVTSIVVANMIGAGIFTTSGLLMQDLQSPPVMLALWIGGGLLALCGALCYGELGAAIPRAGGEYTFLSRLFHPSLGFLTGWVSFFAGFSAPIAASAIGFAEYLTRAFPVLLGSGAGDATSEGAMLKRLYAILVIGVFTAIHFRGLRLGAGVQNALTVLKVLLIVGLIVVGFAFGEGSLAHLSEGEPFVFDFAGWKRLGLALMWITFSYAGWNAAAYIGSEIKDPGRNLPRSLLLGTSTVMLLYLLLNVFYLYAATPAEMSGEISVAGLAAAKSFGRSVETGLSLMISFALFSSLSAFIILGPRVYYSMAKDGLFFRFAGEVHPRHGVPAKSIVLQGLVASLMALFGTFDQILTYMGFSLGIFPILAVIGVFKVRRRGMSPYRMPGFPVVPVAFILVSLAILVLAFFERPVESSIAILTVASGIPAFVAFRAFYGRGTAQPEREDV
jgi:APA family basic amino acid/polyamine antiporter